MGGTEEGENLGGGREGENMCEQQRELIFTQ